MFVVLNIVAGVLHLLLLATILVTYFVLRSKGKVPYKLRFGYDSPTVPTDAPESCKADIGKQPGCCLGNADSGEFCSVYGAFMDAANTSKDEKNRVVQAALTRRKESFSWPLAYVIALFPLITAGFHFFVASPWGNPIYSAQIAAGRNPFRWAEYSITASIMLVAIAGLSNITSVSEVRSIAGLMFATNVLGLAVEDAWRSGSRKTAVAFFVAGTATFLLAYYPILANFMRFASAIKENSSSYRTFFRQFFAGSSIAKNDEAFEIPTFVYVAVYGIFALYFVFPAIMAVRLIVDASYAAQEKAFLIASFASKAFLVIAVASGIARDDPPEYLTDIEVEGGKPPDS